jgi:uncharacterized membrane protein YqgA involved in biofilm formation
MIVGTIVNAVGILLGVIVGLTYSRQLSMPAQVGIKSGLGVVTVFVGLRTTWINLGDGLWGVLKSLTIVILAMMVGRLIGRLLHLQKGLNRLGRWAKERMVEAEKNPGKHLNDGFLTASLLFIVNPMATLGAVENGLSDAWVTLAIKAVLDGLTAMAFVGTFGWSVVFSIIPLVAFQSSVTLGARLIEPFLTQHAVLEPVLAVAGLLIFCLALIILEIKRVELADYLPSLAIAPVLAWFWR